MRKTKRKASISSVHTHTELEIGLCDHDLNLQVRCGDEVCGETTVSLRARQGEGEVDRAGDGEPRACRDLHRGVVENTGDRVRERDADGRERHLDRDVQSELALRSL